MRNNKYRTTLKGISRWSPLGWCSADKDGLALSPTGDTCSALPSQVLILDSGVKSWRPVHKWSPRTLLVSASSHAISHQHSFTLKVFCCLSSTCAGTLLTPSGEGGGGCSVLSWFVKVLVHHLWSERINVKRDCWYRASFEPQPPPDYYHTTKMIQLRLSLSLDFQQNTDSATSLTPPSKYGKAFWFIIFWLCLFW